MSSKFTLYSTPWCGYCHRLKGQLKREGIEFDEVDIEDPVGENETVYARCAEQLEAALTRRLEDIVL